MKIELSRPVQVGSETITSLTLREEVVSGDLRGTSWAKLREADHDTVMKIAGRLCAQPDPVMHALPVADTARLVGVVLGFLADGPATGPTS